MNNNELIEIVKAANSYLSRLHLLENDLDHAIEQINNTYQDTITNIRNTFSTLKESLLQILQDRETTLLNQAHKVRIFPAFILQIKFVLIYR